MRKIWFDEAWEDYLYWQVQDKKTLKRINALLKDIERNNFNGIGKPEPLKGDLSGFWSRRIDDTNRLVYRINNSVYRRGTSLFGLTRRSAGPAYRLTKRRTGDRPLFLLSQFILSINQKIAAKSG